MTWGREYICTNAYDTYTIRCVQIYGGRTFLACAVEFSTPMAHLFCIRLGLLLSKKPCTVVESEVNAG